MDDVNKVRLRKHDFWTSLVLLALAVAMAWEATGYPMTDSYGGVRNVWYVSPALFPLLVAAGLFLLSLVLLINFGPERRRPRDAARPCRPGRIGRCGRPLCGNRRAARGLRLCAGPACRLLHCPGYLSQAFFAVFHVTGRNIIRPCLMIFAAGSACAGALALMGTSSPYIWTVFEGALLAGCLWLPWSAWRGVETEQAAALRHAALTSIAVPAFLCPVFKYALLVPLPAEGIVVQAMDAVRYALRAAGA